MAVAPSTERMIAGLAAASVSLGVAALMGIPFGTRADARTAVGSAAVDLTPGPVKEWVIQTLGALDKPFLAVVVLVVIAAIAAIAGTWETRRRPFGSAVIAAAGALGCVAVLSRQGTTALDTIPTVAGAACGVAVLRLLTRRSQPVSADPGHPDDEARHGAPDAGRRRLIALGLLGFGVLGGVAGAVLTRLVHSVAADRTGFALPRPRTPAPPIPADVQPNGVALPSFITPASDFYRVDTALAVPQLGHGDWRLRVHGMVDREATYSFDDLARFDVVETVTTLTCVSNPVGGKLISTGVWTGYRLTDLLAAAGVHRDADMACSPCSIHGVHRRYTAGRAHSMPATRRRRSVSNGQRLLIEHGDPARLRGPWAPRARVGHEAGSWSLQLYLIRPGAGLLDAPGLGGVAAPIKTGATDRCSEGCKEAVRWDGGVGRRRARRRTGSLARGDVRIASWERQTPN